MKNAQYHNGIPKGDNVTKTSLRCSNNTFERPTWNFNLYNSYQSKRM